MATLLKILTGPHIGAEALLESGETLLGSDLSCDIILVDAGIMPRHLLLRVSSDGTVFILPQEGDVLLKDALVPTEGAPLEYFSPITMGGTVLCVGPADRAWLSHEVPTLAFLGAQAKIALERLAHESNESAQNSAVESVEQDSESSSALADKEPVDAPINMERAMQQKVPQKSSRLRRIILLFFVFVLLCLLTLGVRAYLSEDSTTIINNVLYDGGYEHVRLVQSEGAYVLEGFVPLNTDIVYIEDIIGGVEDAVSVRLFSVEQVKEQTENLIKEVEAPWVIRQKRHTLSINGYAQSQEKGEALLKPVRDRLDAVGAEISFVTWAQLQEALLQNKHYVQLSSKMQMYPDSLGVGIATRVLSKEEQAQLERVLLETSELFGIPFPFVRMANLQEQAAKKTQPMSVIAPVAPVRNICELLWWQREPQGLALELMGETYVQGKRLPSGWLIQELNVKYAVLVLDNQMRVCNAQIKP